MKNYLEFEKEIKALEQEINGLKSPFGSEGISEVDTKKVVCPECGSKKVSRNVTNNSFWSESIDRYNYSKTNNN